MPKEIYCIPSNKTVEMLVDVEIVDREEYPFTGLYKECSYPPHLKKASDLSQMGENQVPLNMIARISDMAQMPARAKRKTGIEKGLVVSMCSS